MLAAVLVVAYHMTYLGLYNGTMPGVTAPDIVQQISTFGCIGVPLFFIISGYVIILSSEGRNRGQFVFARAVRLWPAFVICCLLTVAMLTVDGHPPPWNVVLLNLTMVPRFFRAPYIDGVYWSLMFEIMFYGVVCMLGPGRSNFTDRLRIFIVSWLILSVCSNVIPSLWIRLILMTTFSPFFSVGIAIFLFRRTRSILDGGILGTAVALAILKAMTLASDLRLTDDGTPYPVQADPILVGPVLALLTGLVFFSPRIRFGTGLAGICTVLGGISYPLYLLHLEFALPWVRYVTPAVGSMAPYLVTGGVMVLCYVVWRIEVVIRRGMIRWVRSWRAVPVIGRYRSGYAGTPAEVLDRTG
jgi:peptidoglycan/LPS O-acetylase OafA/YrhL